VLAVNYNQVTNVVPLQDRNVVQSGWRLEAHPGGTLRGEVKRPKLITTGVAMRFRRRPRRETEPVASARVDRVRGGVSIGAILTGVVVAFGAMFLLSALVGGVLAATGVDTTEEVAEGTQEATIGAGITLVVAMFLAYLWGGYAAGRMGRGAGAVNGLLVTLLALLAGVVVVTVVTAMGATANLNLPFGDSRLPIEGENLVEFGAGIGVASLVAMFLGGILGGMLGARWHTRLERRVIERRTTAEDDRLAAEERRRAELRRQEEARAADTEVRGDKTARPEHVDLREERQTHTTRS